MKRAENATSTNGLPPEGPGWATSKVPQRSTGFPPSARDPAGQANRARDTISPPVFRNRRIILVPRRRTLQASYAFGRVPASGALRVGPTSVGPDPSSSEGLARLKSGLL